MSLLVRWATRWDRKALVEMVGALALQHGVETDEKSLGAALEYALSHPQQVRFAVAQLDDQVIATASLHEAYSTWQAAPFGTIEDFFVRPEVRGQGVGTGLLALLVQEARKREYCRIELQVQEENDAAWKFYESRGLRFTGYLVYAQDLADQEQET
jgi:GNAT superfamily N-acetyltransferase